MMKWILWTSLITVVVAIVITWQAERCETASEQCQAATATRPLTNLVPPVSVRPDSNSNQQQSHNQANGACADANGYLCLVLTSANLPTIYLALIGIGGIVVAVATLKGLDSQTKETARSAEAAFLNARAIIDSERAWIDIEFAQSEIIGVVRHSLKITNHGKTPAHILSYDVWHGLVTDESTSSIQRASTHFGSTDYMFLASGKTETLMEDFDINDLFSSAPSGISKGAIGFTVKYEIGGEKRGEQDHETSIVYFYWFLFGSLERRTEQNKYT